MRTVLASHPSEPPKITPKSASPFCEAEYQIAKAITEARWKKLSKQCTPFYNHIQCIVHLSNDLNKENHPPGKEYTQRR
jgi:hypothetical protein